MSRSIFKRIQERRAKPARPRVGYFYLLVVCALTALMVGARDYLLLTDVVTLYLLVIMIGAFRFTRGVSIAVATLSVATYDFFFVPPIYRFAVSDSRHFLSFGLMFTVALTINGLASRIRRQEKDARVREEQARTLYVLTTELAAALDDTRVAGITASHAAEIFGGGAAVMLPDQAGRLVLKGMTEPAFPLDAEDIEAAQWAWENARPAGRGTEAWPGCGVTCVPLQSADRGLGVLVLRREAPGADQRMFLDAFARQAALAIERVRLSEEARASTLHAQTEEMRSSLLSAVSHDLRTPLAAITAAGSTLRDEEGRLSEKQRTDLVETISAESERMDRLIGNLLDMMRLESGGLQPKREWIPLEEIVGSAHTRLEARLATRELTLDLPEDLPLVSVDPVLFEQVFLNLLDNALKYTPATSSIEVRAQTRDAIVEIEVADRGPGLPSGEEATVFAKFWRGTHPGVGGVGLGLAICKGIVDAHGGTITAATRTGGGASFKIGLPVASETATSLKVSHEGDLVCKPK